MRPELPLIGLLGSLIAGFFALPAATKPAPVTEPGKVPLAVLVVFDQMRGDYIEKWQQYLRPDGFKRLQTQGAWFTDCQYPYGTTTTAPGHASMLSGTTGSVHGITNNNWFDRASGEEVYSAGSDRYQIVPARPESKTNQEGKPAAKKKPKPVGSPDRMLSETVGDVIKATRPNGKVFGVSLKDRSAIFPTGKKSDGAYWFDGRFATSTYYRDAVHPWVKAFNESGKSEQYFTQTWNRFRPDLDYTAIVGADDGPGEGKGVSQGVMFPHPMNGGKPDKLGQEYYEALANSPFGNDLLTLFAKECISAEQLGQRGESDLLVISYSSNDLVGHTWGPDSQEVFDTTLRSDAMIADLLNFLDQKVGAGKYTLVITADHGICPNPEVSTAKGIDAARISPKKLVEETEAFLSKSFGAVPETGGKPDRWVESLVAPNLYLNRKLIQSKNLKVEDVAAKVSEWLPSQKGIMRAIPASEFKLDKPDDSLFTLSKNSFHAERSGDVVIISKPYYLLDSYGTGTTHGAPHSYDTHAVFLAYGPGIAGGVRTERVAPQNAAPILSAALGIPLPKDCTFTLPKTLLKP
jgi:predicted AlkP superfamily pyrophosphatase or phosphodiesterase